ncbi:unnamed protein product [Caenorhabditis nigoni]
MEATSDPIKNNHHYIKACILYEVLQKKPIFESYRNFCSTVGQDAMEYPDFEFWYYRFYRGQMDFDYDRRADPEPKTLVDIPVVSMKKIAESLDAVERTHLRTMNHAIKDVADSFPPVFEKIEIKLSEKDLSWSWNDKNYSCHKKCRGYSLSRPDNSIVENSNTCYIKKGLEYLTPVLKMPNIQVNHFSLHLEEEAFDPVDLLGVPMNAKSVSIYGRKINQVIQPLSAMNPGHLESISIDGMLHTETYPVNLDMIRETDQFKQSKSVEMKGAWSFHVEELRYFSHLKRFKCRLMSDNTLADVPRLREIISTFEGLESCELGYTSILGHFPIVQIAQALGAEIPIGPLVQRGRRTITHHYHIPESNERLEFEIKEVWDSCLIKIVKIR